MKIVISQHPEFENVWLLTAAVEGKFTSAQRTLVQAIDHEDAGKFTVENRKVIIGLGRCMVRGGHPPYSVDIEHECWSMMVMKWKRTVPELVNNARSLGFDVEIG